MNIYFYYTVTFLATFGLTLFAISRLCQTGADYSSMKEMVDDGIKFNDAGEETRFMNSLSHVTTMFYVWYLLFAASLFATLFEFVYLFLIPILECK